MARGGDPGGKWSHVYVASVWGQSGSSSDAALRRVNERLLVNSILHTSSMGDVPYFLCGDFNCALSESRVLTMSKASGKVIDLAHVEPKRAHILSDGAAARGYWTWHHSDRWHPG